MIARRSISQVVRHTRPVERGFWLGVWLAGLAFGLVGCAVGVTIPSGPTVVPVGSVVALRRPLTIPAGTARVTLQHGRASNGASEWDPSCAFTVDEVSDGTQRIEPDRFHVVSFSQRRAPYGLAWRGVRVAAVGIGVGVGGGGVFGGGFFDTSRRVVYVTFMRLHSDEQPQVRALECKVTSDPLGEFLSVEQIREALGAIATLELPSA